MIFKAYARVSANQAVQRKTFDLMPREYSLIRLGPFIKFCREFKIPIKLNQ